MTQQLIKTKPEEKKQSVLATMAARIEIEPSVLLKMLKDTAFKGATDSEFVALCVVANELKLNPLTKQLYAFPKKGGGIEAMVPIDGWLAMINRHDQFDGMTTSDIDDDKGQLVACECTIHRKDRKHPTVIREYLTECRRKTEPWEQMPRRMLRNKAIIQAGRIAFALSGVVDEDDAAIIGERQAKGREVEADPMTAGIKKEAVLTLDNSPESPMERLGRMALERKVGVDVLFVEAAEAGIVKEQHLDAYTDEEIEKVIASLA
ncbi:MAG: recombinase RecT [Alphaproteobacteria bacterium]|nr:recombinase RecT [Alphaproteobacteria bacterium]